MRARCTAGPAALALLALLASARPSPAAPSLDLAGADALAASQAGDERGGMLARWASHASLADLLFVLRRGPSELGANEAPLVEAALERCGGRPALQSRLAARLALAAPQRARKQIEALGGRIAPRPRASVFRVAALLPGSGSYESYGRAVRVGLAAGLADGGAPALELRTWSTGEDDPGRTAAVLDSALETSGVIVGELLSVPTLSLATGARIGRAVLISPTATDENVGAVGSQVFQIGPSAARRAAALARACVGGTPRGVGALQSTQSVRGGLGDRFVAAAESLSLPVVWRDSYAPGTVDFRAAVRTMLAQKVDVLFWDGDPRDADALLGQLARDRLAIRLCGGEALSPDQHHAEMRAMLEGARHVAEDWQVPPRVVARLDSAARAAGDERSGPLHVRGWLAGRFIAAAVRGGALCPEEVAAAFAARVERAGGEPSLRFLDCTAEGAALPVYTVTRGKSVPAP